MNYAEAKAKLESIGQTQLLRYYDELDDASRERLLGEIDKTDFSHIDINAEPQEVANDIRPLDAMTVSEIEQHRDEFEQIGLDAIRAGKVACVLLAGGQGTRLGADGPKGAYNVGLTRDLYIFECQINNIKNAADKAGCPIPLAVMTSDKNDEQTRAFFEEHDFFGYDRDHVDFFIQEMAPSTDYEGKVYLEAKDHISLSPNGNGGWFKSLAASGIADRYRAEGVEWINVYAVDNVLQKMADPVFVGATIQSGCEIGAKVISKAAPDEKVGVMCLKDGRPSIVEYYELTDEMMELKNADGRLAYNWGVILNYLLDLNALFRNADLNMPYHVVEKKIPHLDESGNLIKPESPNGYKFETLILDMISMMNGCLPFEVIREKEFAPVKNLHGIDSVDSARELLKANGVEL